MGVDLWNAYGMLGSKQTSVAFEKAFWMTLGKLRDKGPSVAQLAAAKRGMIADEVFAQDSLYLRAKEIGELESVGIGADKRDAWLAAIRNVTAADVKRVLKRWIRPKRATIGVLQPEARS